MSTEKPTKCDVCGSSFDSYKAMRVHKSRAGHMEKPWRDKEKLQELYVEKRLGSNEIADRLGCGQTAILDALKDFNIQTRSLSESKKAKRAKEPPAFRTCPSGYEEVLNKHDGKQHVVRVSRLAAVAWFGYEDVCGNHVHHKNEIPWDNRESNLEVMTPKEHHKHHYRQRETNEKGQMV